MLVIHYHLEIFIFCFTFIYLSLSSIFGQLIGNINDSENDAKLLIGIGRTYENSVNDYIDETALWNRHQDVMFVKAGGNEGVVVNAHGLPIGNNVILVGAVDSNNKRVSWSNKPGHALKHHWVMAPGVSIKGAMANNHNSYLHNLQSLNRCNYQQISFGLTGNK